MTDTSPLAQAEARRDALRSALDTDASARASEHRQSEVRQAQNRVDELRYRPLAVIAERLTEQKRVISDQISGLSHQLTQHRVAVLNHEHARLSAMAAGSDPTEHRDARDEAEQALRQAERDLDTARARLAGIDRQLADLAAEQAAATIAGKPAAGAQQ